MVEFSNVLKALSKTDFKTQIRPIRINDIDLLGDNTELVIYRLGIAIGRVSDAGHILTKDKELFSLLMSKS